jgi:hypothetical protein
VKRRSMAVSLVLFGLLSSACAGEPRAGTQAPEPSPKVTAKPSPKVTAQPSPKVTAQPSSNAAPAWDQFPTLEPSGDIPVGEFNAYLESAEPPWATSPLRASLEFLRLDEPVALTTSIVMETHPPEGGEQAEVTVTKEGLADDSIGAIRYGLEFERQADDSWRLLSAVWAQRCQGGRGHQDFTPELCI